MELAGGDPIWIGRASDSRGVPLTTHLSEESVVGYPERCIESIEHHALRFVGEFLAGRGHARARVGVEMEAYYYTARCHAMLDDVL